MGLRLLTLSGAVLLAGMAALLWVRPGADRGEAPLPVLGTVGAFTVTNQAGLAMEAEALRGRPWAANLIFTRCPGPCPQLTGTLRRVQDGLPPGSPSRLLSVTSDPDFDTPAVLQAYASRFGVDTRRWQFVTGSREQIRSLVTKQLLMVLVDKTEEQRESPEDLFLHSTLIVVVDRAGRLRTAVEGLSPGAHEQVLAALRQLEREP